MSDSEKAEKQVQIKEEPETLVEEPEEPKNIDEVSDGEFEPKESSSDEEPPEDSFSESEVAKPEEPPESSIAPEFEVDEELLKEVEEMFDEFLEDRMRQLRLDNHDSDEFFNDLYYEIHLAAHGGKPRYSIRDKDLKNYEDLVEDSVNSGAALAKALGIKRYQDQISEAIFSTIMEWQGVKAIESRK